MSTWSIWLIEIDISCRIWGSHIIKSYIIWHSATSSPLNISRRFIGKYCFYLKIGIIRKGRNHHKAFSKETSHCFYFVSVPDPENGADIFLRNVGWLSTDYKAMYITTQRSGYFVLMFSHYCNFNFGVCFVRANPQSKVYDLICWWLQASWA
jgi:hypothetical protein